MFVQTAVVTYTCNAGYITENETKLTCIDGQWSPNTPPLCTKSKNLSAKTMLNGFVLNLIQGELSKRYPVPQPAEIYRI